jgi:hypothetical protein
MTLTSYSSSSIAWLAVAAGAVQLIGVVSLAVFFAIGEPFGTLNDICIALAAVLSALLAWRLLAEPTGPALTLAWLALGSAVLGALVVVAGNALVVFRIRSFVLAGFWAQFGYAFVGVWLLAACIAAQNGTAWPRGLVILGIVAGAFMLFGFLTLPALVRGLDTMTDSPWYVNMGYVSWIGAMFLLPAWCLWLARVLANAPAVTGAA